MGDNHDDINAELQNLFEAEDAIIMSEHGEAVQQLMALSQADVEAITPGVTDMETYNRLIAVVKDASARNLSQAQLKARIMAMGETAVSIAKKAGKLAALFV